MPTHCARLFANCDPCSLQPVNELAVIFSPVLQIENLRLTDDKCLAQCHVAENDRDAL